MVAIYKSVEIIETIQYMLCKKCTNNQAEQIAIFIALEYLEKLQETDKRVKINTES